MISEDQKYRSEAFRISGFALMTPIGKLVLDVIGSNFANLSSALIPGFMVSFLLFLGGIIMIQRGYESVQ